MTNLNKISHKLMDSNHKLKAKCGLMEKENERLSKENEQLRKDATTLIYANQDYRHENEQLKQKIKSITEILNKDIGYVESFRKIEEVLK